MLPLLEFDLRRSADLDDGNATGELRETLLELLTIPIGIGIVDLLANLLHTGLDVCVGSGTLDDRRVVLADDDLAGLAEQVHRDSIELETDLFGDDGRTGEDGDILELSLAALPESGGLDGHGLERATDLVHDECRECFTLDVLSNDQQRLARLHDLLENREHILDRADLRVDDQHIRVFEDGFLTIGVTDEVRRDVALVELHTFRELELNAECLAVLDGDDTLVADLLHRIGDTITDDHVRSRVRSDIRDGFFVVARYRLRRIGDILDDLGDGLFDAALHLHRVASGCDETESVPYHRLCEDRCRRRAVTGNVVGLVSDFLSELRPHVLERVFEFDLLGDRHTIVRDRGRTPLLVEYDVAPLGTQRYLDGICELVDARLEAPSGLLVET